MGNALIIAGSSPLSSSHAQERATGISPASMLRMRGGEGLQTAERAFTRAASATVRAALPEPFESDAAPPSTAPAAVHTPPLDMATGIVAQMEAKVAFKANLAVYRTADALYRALLKATA